MAVLDISGFVNHAAVMHSIKISSKVDERAWGELKADTVNVAEAGRLQAEAVRLMDRAGYR